MCRKKYLEDQFREMHFYKEELEATWKKDEMKRDVLNSVWPEVNSVYKKFKNDIVKFLKNEKLR